MVDGSPRVSEDGEVRWMAADDNRAEWTTCEAEEEWQRLGLRSGSGLEKDECVNGFGMEWEGTDLCVHDGRGCVLISCWRMYILSVLMCRSSSSSSLASSSAPVAVVIVEVVGARSSMDCFPLPRATRWQLTCPGLAGWQAVR